MNTKERVTQSSPVNFLPGLIDIFLKKTKARHFMLGRKRLCSVRVAN
jgi:hypothetical protein